MAGFNGNGVYVRPYNWTNDANSGTDILASKFDTDGNDVATALSTCLCKDGQQTATAQIPFAQGITVAVGSVSTPSINIVGDTGTGIYQPSASAGTVAFASNGTLTATINGNGLDNTVVGAGTPAAGHFTTINKVTLTAPASAATITIANNKTLTVSNTLTLAGTDSTTMTFPSSTDTVVTLGATQTLTNKTLTAPAIGAATGTSLSLSGLTASAALATDGSKNLVSAVPTSWTPVLKFGGGTTGITYTTQAGTYVQIGKVVVAEFRIALSSNGSATGSATITGLPATMNSADRGSVVISYYGNVSGMSAPLCRIDPSTTIILLGFAGSATPTNMADTNFSSTSEICGTAVYLST